MPGDGEHHHQRKAAGHQDHPGAGGGVPEHLLHELRDQHRSGVEDEAHDEHEQDDRQQAAVFQQAQVHDRLPGNPEFPDDRADNADNRQKREELNEVRAKPVLFLSFVQHHLKATQAQGHEGKAEVIDLQSVTPDGFVLAYGPGGFVHQPAGQDQRQDANGNVDEKDPAPVVIVGDPPAERRTDRRRDHHGDAIQREGHSALPRLEGVGEDRLLAGASPPPPMPCRTRKTRSQPSDGAMPQRNEESVKSATHDI